MRSTECQLTVVFLFSFRRAGNITCLFVTHFEAAVCESNAQKMVKAVIACEIVVVVVQVCPS